MFVADAINLREIVMREPLPLVTIQNAVIDFVRGRHDVVLFGAQAVNVYVKEPRATQDVDLMSPRPAELAEELRSHLSGLFHIAVRVSQIKDGLGYRVFQIRKDGNRHLVDVRAVTSLPATGLVESIQVLAPAELIAGKVISHWQRRGKSKSFTDRRDLVVLLLAFPDLKAQTGPVFDCLKKNSADPGALDLWREIVDQPILPETDEDEF